ncbi:hypothetical protein MNBD_DELTA02-732 [hydrothermal vent metagenome]|uniref:Uncharacterized protein n=1 Tax=hydrothermal vent metagenome TaxID=652676 RepID=A0A3B0VZU1_9ZZZZ
MGDIARSMRKKGYEPLATDSFGGIGFKKNLKVTEEEGPPRYEPWQGDLWFDTGKRMQDGKTPRTVVAKSAEQYREYLKKGYLPLKRAGNE